MAHRKGSLVLGLSIPIVILAALVIWLFVLWGGTRDRLRKDLTVQLGKVHRDCLEGDREIASYKPTGPGLLSADKEYFRLEHKLQEMKDKRDQLESDLYVLGVKSIVYERRDDIEEFMITVTDSNDQKYIVKASEIREALNRPLVVPPAG